MCVSDQNLKYFQLCFQVCREEASPEGRPVRRASSRPLRAARTNSLSILSEGKIFIYSMLSALDPAKQAVKLATSTQARLFNLYISTKIFFSTCFCFPFVIFIKNSSFTCLLRSDIVETTKNKIVECFFDGFSKSMVDSKTPACLTHIRTIYIL